MQATVATVQDLNQRIGPGEEETRASSGVLLSSFQSLRAAGLQE
jgi:hypothetical protein